MPSWLPIVLAVVFWSFLLLTVLVRFLRAVRALRAGIMSHAAFTVHVTADFISIGVGLGVAFSMHRLVANWMPWGGLVGFVAYFITALIGTMVVAKLYQRMVDGRVRQFLQAGSADAVSEEGQGS